MLNSDHLAAAERHMAIANGTLQPTCAATTHAQAEAQIVIAQQLTRIGDLLESLVDAVQNRVLERDVEQLSVPG
jgi:hypothetical protein